MELYIQIILVLAMMKFCLKAAMSSRLWVILCYALGASLFSLSMYPIVIEQPLTMVSDLLLNKKIVTDIAVLTSIEAISGIFISILLLDNYFTERAKRKRYLKVLKVIPGVIFMFGVAYFQLQFFKIRVGADFLTTALLYSSILFISITITALLLQKVVKAESMKLELKILLNMGILVIGLLVNSTIADYNLSYAETAIEWTAMITMLLICSLMVSLGYLLSKLKFKKFKIK